MKKVVLSSLLIVAVFLSACGGGADSSSGSSAQGTSEPFRIPVDNVSVRYASELKFKANGLVGAEPKPIAPEGPAPLTLALEDLIEGIGAGAASGSTVTIQYVGYDYDLKKFESSWDQGKPFTFKLGSGQAVAGLEQGIEGMEVGGRREVVVPPGLTYGGSQQKAVPPNSNLIFVVDLLGVGEGE